MCCLLKETNSRCLALRERIERSLQVIPISPTTSSVTDESTVLRISARLDDRQKQVSIKNNIVVF